MAKLTVPVVVDWDDIKEHVKDYLPHWIPCSERLPEDLKDVLCWYEYFRYGDYNCMFQTYGVGFYDHQFNVWGGDVSGHKFRVIAWMPLPEPYRGGRA